MLVEKVRQIKDPFQRLVYWVKERESIRIKKSLKVPRPWTDDEILRDYRFCNVRRMDDKVSQWLLINWYKPYKNHPCMIQAVALARYFNLPSTLEAIGFPAGWTMGDKVWPELAKARARNLRGDGPIFNNAYMVRGNDKEHGEDKVEAVIDYYIQPLVDTPPIINRHSMQETWENLRPYYGMGSFVAGQVVADLRHAITGTWKDRLTWAPVGPGSKRGMNRLHNRPIEAALGQEQFLTELRELIARLKCALSHEIFGRLEAIDFQNICCETDKYNRALYGEGRPKQLYRPVDTDE